jgi:hypothetical protein
VHHRRLVLVAVLTALAAPIASAEASSSGLTIAGTGPVEIAAKQGSDEATGSLVVLNRGARSVGLTAELQAATAPKVTLAHLEPKRVVPGATRVDVVVTGLKSVDEKIAGELVLTGDGALVAVGVTITPAPQPSRNWAHDILLGASVLAAALFVLVALLVLAKEGWKRLFASAPGPKWSFSESWASTLTTSGAVLGTVLGSATLPAVPREIDKQTLVGLNLLFGAAVVAAPFLFQTIRNPRADSTSDDGGGFNVTLLLACAITFGAVEGELAALALLAWEIVGSSWHDTVAAVGILAGALAAYYFLVTTFWLARKDWATVPTRAVLSSDRETVVVAEPQRWSLP